MRFLKEIYLFSVMCVREDEHESRYLWKPEREVRATGIEVKQVMGLLRQFRGTKPRLSEKAVRTRNP